jgi:5-methyltetrahydrofolate--homocysteine methyltransferase
MVTAEEIVRAALEHRPDAIGLSGLITPSLHEMVSVVSQLAQAGIHVPVMIGGATTSALHTALKIAPVYDGPVLWLKDASQNCIRLAPFVNPCTRDKAFASLLEEQAAIRQNYQSQPLVPLDVARKNKPKFF